MQEILIKVEWFTAELILTVQESVKIKSLEAPPLEGRPYGAAIAEALKHALEIAHRLGFKTVNLDGHIGYAENMVKVRNTLLYLGILMLFRKAMAGSILRLAEKYMTVKFSGVAQLMIEVLFLRLYLS